MNLARKTGLLLLGFFLSHSVFSQYILNGSAQKNSCNCYTLTQPTSFQSGSVWNSHKISLTDPFDFWFNVYLGCNDATGADGIVFILQPLSTSVGSSGEGMGFGGVTPSIGIALDTWQNGNLNDPAFDHISIQSNGQINHNTDLAGPIPISAQSDNVEDCQWHRLRISWDPATHWLRTWFDGVPRVEKQIDLTATIFNGDPMVYWGFTGATGGSVNLQQFCTALDPDFSLNLTGNGGCVGTPLSFTNQSQSFAPITSYNWNFGDNTTSTLQTPPPHTYAQSGTYPVHLSITGLDGCQNDTVKNITIGSIPDATLTVYDTCFHRNPRIAFIGTNAGMSYQWSLDGSPASTTAQPPIDNLPAGPHSLRLILTSLYGCGSPDTATSIFQIKQISSIAADSEQFCRHFVFTGTQLDNATWVQSWNWTFGDGGNSQDQNPTHDYASEGDFLVRFWAMNTNGCASDTLSFQVHVADAHVNAGHDTVLVRGLPGQLFAAANGPVLWSPATGLSDPTIPNPVATLQNNQVYLITATTDAGCTATDTLRVRVFEGPAIYMPNAFTPNGDGRNDRLLPVYVGIRKLEEFSIYDRWGGRAFTTQRTEEGWDGRRGGREQSTGTYVWFIRAITEAGEPMLLRGTVTLIR